MKTTNATRLIWLARAVIVAVTDMQIMLEHDLAGRLKAAYAIGIFLLQLNDFGRSRYPLIRRNRPLYGLSVTASIIVSGLYMYRFDSFALSIYYVFPLFEIFVRHSAIKLRLLSLHALVYLCLMYALKSDLKGALLPYAAILLVVYFFRQTHLEKEKSESLNAQLLEANAKLLAYSREIKEATIIKERTTIAQELHDSIGHALVAIRMHLEFARQVLESRPLQSQEALGKALAISQNSMAALRKAVSVLEEGAAKNSMPLQESLQEIAQHMQMDGRLHIELQFDQTVEDAIPDIKNGIYKTVQEAITNGVRHGSAERFQIAVTANGHAAIRVVIKNDGRGCGAIVKSRGLLGMEERIALLKGTIQFDSEQNGGFAVTAEIPFVTTVRR